MKLSYLPILNYFHFHKIIELNINTKYLAPELKGQTNNALPCIQQRTTNAFTHTVLIIQEQKSQSNFITLTLRFLICPMVHGYDIYFKLFLEACFSSIFNCILFVFFKKSSQYSAFAPCLRLTRLHSLVIPVSLSTGKQRWLT